MTNSATPKTTVNTKPWKPLKLLAADNHNIRFCPLHFLFSVPFDCPLKPLYSHYNPYITLTIPRFQIRLVWLSPHVLMMRRASQPLAHASDNNSEPQSLNGSETLSPMNPNIFISLSTQTPHTNPYISLYICIRTYTRTHTKSLLSFRWIPHPVIATVGVHGDFY